MGLGRFGRFGRRALRLHGVSLMAMMAEPLVELKVELEVEPWV